MNTSVWRSGWLAALAVLAGGFSAGLRADEPAAKPAAGPYTVIVGVGEFEKDPSIKPRPSAETDAKAFYDLLTDPKYFPTSGTPAADRVQLLLSKPDEKRHAAAATHDAIVKAVDAAVARTGKDDLVILAFFGRGASAGDKTCFFTPDTVFADRSKTGLLGSDLEADLKKLKGQKVLFYMDVSFKGYDPGKEKLAEPNLSDILTGMFGGEDKEDSALPTGPGVHARSIPTIEPLVRDGRGLFASIVLDALKGKADVERVRAGRRS